MAKYLSPQYWDTNCLICSKQQFAATENVVCDSCMEGNTVPEFIAKLQKEIAKLLEEHNAGLLVVNTDVDD